MRFRLVLVNEQTRLERLLEPSVFLYVFFFLFFLPAVVLGVMAEKRSHSRLAEGWPGGVHTKQAVVWTQALLWETPA